MLAGSAAAAALLNISFQAISSEQLPVITFDDEAKAAVRRLKARSERAGVELWEQLLVGGVADWEAMITSSFKAGMSQELLDTTVQQQVGSGPCSSAQVPYEFCVGTQNCH